MSTQRERTYWADSVIQELEWQADELNHRLQIRAYRLADNIEAVRLSITDEQVAEFEAYLRLLQHDCAEDAKYYSAY